MVVTGENSGVTTGWGERGGTCPGRHFQRAQNREKCKKYRINHYFGIPKTNTFVIGLIMTQAQ